MISKAFLKGVGSVLNIWPTGTKKTPQVNASEAPANAWKAVGDDIRKALDDFKKAVDSSKDS